MVRAGEQNERVHLSSKFEASRIRFAAQGHDLGVRRGPPCDFAYGSVPKYATQRREVRNHSSPIKIDR